MEVLVYDFALFNLNDEFFEDAPRRVDEDEVLLEASIYLYQLECIVAQIFAFFLVLDHVSLGLTIGLLFIDLILFGLRVVFKLKIDRDFWVCLQKVVADLQEVGCLILQRS